MTAVRDIPITEAGLQDAAVEIGRLLGWLAVHMRPARTAKGWRTPVAYDGKGFFDVTFVHPAQGRLKFVEFKSDTGKRSPEQEVWAERMEEVVARNPFVEMHLWTPEDWPGRIIEAFS